MKRTDDLSLAYRLLDHCMFLSLSMSDTSGMPYCVPISPVREDRTLYFHCGLKGRKIDVLRANPNVCLTCIGTAEVIPGAFETAFESMTAFGTAEEITDQLEKRRILELICDKYCPDDLWDLPRVLEKYLPATGIWKLTMEIITTKGPPASSDS